ncbi:ZN271 protein, partial [Nyctiprogne leucopyga]|nr:ZN271 protein [Nyctiprogne leucopyga]
RCEECGLTFRHATTFLLHQQTHSGTFSCPLCPQHFEDSTQLARHRRRHHPPLTKPYRCDACGKAYAQP